MTTKSFRFLCDKYFNPENFIVDSYEYVTKVLKGEISPFDQLFKASALKHDIDWRLVASIAFQETKFHPNARGFGGAYSIMQFMPGTGPKYGVFPHSTVEKQIDGGAKKISQDFKSWSEIPDTNQRMKFTIATYNCGRSHVEDAQRLAKKVGFINSPTAIISVVPSALKSLKTAAVTIPIFSNAGFFTTVKTPLLLFNK